MTKKPEPDMSAPAITARLEALRQLYRLGMSLRQAGKQAGLYAENNPDAKSSR